MTDATQTIAVIGAGWLGGEVARRAVRRHSSVLATTRSGRWHGSAPAPEGVRVEQFDILSDDETHLRSLLRGVDGAIFCYAPSSDQDRGRLYVEGAARIARACAAEAPSRVVYTSSTSALAAHDGWVDESAQEWPDAPRGRVQREAETTLARGLDGASIPWTILRLAGLYGPGRELARIYRVAETDRVRPGDGLERTNLVHLDDAAGAVLRALELPASETGVIHVCDDDHRTRREVTADVARAAGFPPPRWEVDATDHEPRGKKVANDAMKKRLDLELKHPTHHA